MEYIAPAWQSWLGEQGIKEFADWWDLDLPQVDDGNHERGGWSKVFYFERGDKAFYVKRQSNYRCINFASFPFWVPTVRAEFKKIAWYQKAQVPSLSVVYFGWSNKDGNDDAILVTEALQGYSDLDETISSKMPTRFTERKGLSQAVGKMVAQLHQAGIEHHNLYPKHIFVKKEEDQWKVRFIDLETSRPHFGFMRRKLRELETLARRANGVNKTDKLRGLLAYLGKSKVDSQVRRYIKLIEKRSRDKAQRA